uniref:Chlororespiratory reduction 4 n=1 Tax=Quercus lobata TaxID=97700 RepID=A0A7N2MJN0_QUELO
MHGLHESDFVLPKLITLASELVSLDYAVRIFRNSQYPNVISYNTMIKCFVGRTHQGALRVYDQMKALAILPNSFTFTFLLRCFESFEALGDGRVIHGDIVKLGFGSSVFVQNTLLDFYAKCGGNLDSACRVFEEMPERDVVSWNSMISGYMAHGEVEFAIGLFDLMPEMSMVSWNSVVSGLSKAGNMELARSVFERMPERNEVSWNSMISGYVRLGDIKSAQYIFDQMPKRTVVSWTAMISGCTMIGDLESARNVFDQMQFKNVFSWNAMIAGYVHNHEFDRAFYVFHQMLIDGKCRPDQTTLLSVLSACSHMGSLEHGKWIDSYTKRNNFDGSPSFNGQCKEALALFGRMHVEGIKPDDVIFIAVLSACTHGGLVEEGERVFDQMVHKFGIVPRIEHYGCMVDLLGRAGKLEEAVRFIKGMHLEPNAVIWATLLVSCKIHGNGDMLESVTRKIMELEPSNPNYLTLISNLSASIGQWRDALISRVAMRQQGMEKVPGCSSIQVGDKVNEFLARDTSHEERKEIYWALSCLNGHLKAWWLPSGPSLKMDIKPELEFIVLNEIHQSIGPS